MNESGAIDAELGDDADSDPQQPDSGHQRDGGDIDLLVGSGDTGHGGNMTLTAGDTTDDNHRGGFLTLLAEGNTAGGEVGGEGVRRVCGRDAGVRPAGVRMRGAEHQRGMYEAVLRMHE